ncbi:MAG: hypothetical protein E6L09_03530 [Verrucomicrobia bacterium]|nr:MAG: hypothetical protein E6L09_03530 [Verrucomicrobiota bacterium]
MPSHTRSGFQLRRATRADLPALIELIAALAQFEKLPPPNAEEQERLMEDGFGERPRFEAWLAFGEGETKPVGYAVFFETYSTFRATPTFYLEYIFVTSTASPATAWKSSCPGNLALTTDHCET